MRVLLWVSIVLALLACQGDPLGGERFEINAEEEDEEYCDDDDDDGDGQTLTLVGEIVIYDGSGVEQHTGKIEAFELVTTLTCTDNKPTSIDLTPVGNASQSGEVSYSYDNSGTDAYETVSLTFAPSTATLEKDPPVVHEDHRFHTWFGYDAADPWRVRIVLHKREKPDNTLDAGFHIVTYALRGVAFSDGTEGQIELRLSE